MAKKILIINTSYEGGGAAVVARGVFDYLNQNGFDAYFAYGRGRKSKDDKTFKFGNIFETLIFILIVRFYGKEGVGPTRATLKLIEHIKVNNFDAIHLHNLHGYYLNLPLLFKFFQEENIPLIWTLHDEWALNPLKAHSINKYSYPRTYNPFLPKSWFEEKKKWFSELNTLNIVCPAHWLEDKIKNSYLQKFHTRLIRNGVDVNLFKPALTKVPLRKKYNLPTDKKIILFGVGDLQDKNKGVDYIFKTAELLKDKPYLFLGVGRGGSLDEKNVKIIPYMKDRQSLAEIFQCVDLFCSTSLADTQPLVVLEAFASGLPVVGFDIPAMQELVKNDVGTLVPVRNSRMLSDAIVENLGKNYTAKSHSARNLSIYKFLIQDSLRHYKALFDQILK